METPALYHGGIIDPFVHLQEHKKGTVMQVFYATNRIPHLGQDKFPPYGNRLDKELHLGVSTLRFGDKDFAWDKLYAASVTDKREQAVNLMLEKTEEFGTLAEDLRFSPQVDLSLQLQNLADAINTEIDDAEDKEIMVYIHGTKVDFFNSVAMTAELDHFTGRDFVSVAFSWPSHQNILYYLFGPDVSRADDSSKALRLLLEFLASYTRAEQINLLSYSAGGRVLSKALYELRQDYRDLGKGDLQDIFRIGAVVFAAADVPLQTFHQRLPAIGDLAEQVVVTVSDHDPALEAAEKFMGGGHRIGETVAEAKELSQAEQLGLDNFEVIDLSLDQQGRGFDIVGHHYWYRHPWASSDIVLLLRTNLPPHKRGLSTAEFEGIYYMSANYPEDAREATRRALGNIWYRSRLPH